MQGEQQAGVERERLLRLGDHVALDARDRQQVVLAVLDIGVDQAAQREGGIGQRLAGLHRDIGLQRRAVVVADDGVRQLVGVDEVVAAVDAEHHRVGDERIGAAVVVAHRQVDGVQREGDAGQGEGGNLVDGELADHRARILDVGVGEDEFRRRAVERIGEGEGRIGDGDGRSTLAAHAAVGGAPVGDEEDLVAHRDQVAARQHRESGDDGLWQVVLVENELVGDRGVGEREAVAVGDRKGDGEGPLAGADHLAGAVVVAHGAGRDGVELAVDLETVGVDLHRRQGGVGRHRVDLVDVDGEDVRADGRHPGVDIGAGDHREDDVHVGVVDQIGVSVSGGEGVVRRLGQVQQRFHPVVGDVDVVGDPVDRIDEELALVGIDHRYRTVGAAVEQVARRGDRIGEGDLRAVERGGERRHRSPAVADRVAAQREGDRTVRVGGGKLVGRDREAQARRRHGRRAGVGVQGIAQRLAVVGEGHRLVGGGAGQLRQVARLGDGDGVDRVDRRAIDRELVVLGHDIALHRLAIALLVDDVAIGEAGERCRLRDDEASGHHRPERSGGGGGGHGDIDRVGGGAVREAVVQHRIDLGRIAAVHGYRNVGREGHDGDEAVVRGERVGRVVGIDEDHLRAVANAVVDDSGAGVGEVATGQARAGHVQVGRAHGTAGGGPARDRDAPGSDRQRVAQRHAEGRRGAAAGREDVVDVAAGAAEVGDGNADVVGRASRHLEIAALAEVAVDLVAVAFADRRVGAQREDLALDGIGELVVGDGVVLLAVERRAVGRAAPRQGLRPDRDLVGVEGPGIGEDGLDAAGRDGDGVVAQEIGDGTGGGELRGRAGDEVVGRAVEGGFLLHRPGPGPVDELEVGHVQRLGQVDHAVVADQVARALVHEGAVLQDRIGDAVAGDGGVVDPIDDLADGHRIGIGFGRDREAVVGGGDRVAVARGGQRIGGAVSDDLVVQRIELVDVVLDGDDVALGDVELPGNGRAGERSVLQRDGVLRAVQLELAVVGVHRHVGAAAAHRIGLDVGIDDVDRAVERELIRVDRQDQAGARDADVGAGAVDVEGVEVVAVGEHLRRGHQRIAGRAAAGEGVVGQHRAAVDGVAVEAEADDVAIARGRREREAGLDRHREGRADAGDDGHLALHRIVGVLPPVHPEHDGVEIAGPVEHVDRRHLSARRQAAARHRELGQADRRGRLGRLRRVERGHVDGVEAGLDRVEGEGGAVDRHLGVAGVERIALAADHQRVERRDAVARRGAEIHHVAVAVEGEFRRRDHHPDRIGRVGRIDEVLAAGGARALAGGVHRRIGHGVEGVEDRAVGLHRAADAGRAAGHCRNRRRALEGPAELGADQRALAVAAERAVGDAAERLRGYLLVQAMRQRAVERRQLQLLGIEGLDRGRPGNGIGDVAGVELRDQHRLLVLAQHVQAIAVEAGRSGDGRGLHGLQGSARGLDRDGRRLQALANGLDRYVGGRLAGRGGAEHRIDEVGQLVDLRHQVLRIDVVGRLRHRRDRGGIGGRRQRHLQGEGVGLENHPAAGIEHVGIELVVVAVGVEVVLGDLVAGARAVVHQAHRVALVDQLERTVVQRVVVVAGEQEEVVFRRQAVERAGIGAGRVASQRGDIAVRLLVEEDRSGHAVFQVQADRDHRAEGIHHPQGLRVHLVLEVQHQRAGAVAEGGIGDRRGNVGDVVGQARRGQRVVGQAPVLARQADVGVVERDFIAVDVRHLVDQRHL